MIDSDQYLARINAWLITRTDLLLGDLPGRYQIAEWRKSCVPPSEAAGRIIRIACQRMRSIVKKTEQEQSVALLLKRTMRSEQLRNDIARLTRELEDLA